VPDRRDIASWLPGSGPARPPADGADYPGKRLGRPAEGPGSIAGNGRRFVSVLIDWLVCWMIARAFFGDATLHWPGSLWTNLFIGIENVLLVGTGGWTLGQRIVNVRVESLDGGHPGLAKAAIRGVLLGLGIPAITMLWERDRRGLHELASGTLVARR
jgi:uncharacterized RDD family membrane protein YckC